MSKYYDALNGNMLDTERARLQESPRTKVVAKRQQLASWPSDVVSHADNLTQLGTSFTPVPPEVPAVQNVAETIATQYAIRQLSERIAPRAVVERSCRVAIAGCQSGDGASSIATALAFDLSQRLCVRTLLVDANVRAPSLERVLSVGKRRTGEIILGCSLQLLATGHSRQIGRAHV